MEDESAKVRAAAYHTLEDGGRLDDPRLGEIFKRAWANETDRKVLAFPKEFDGDRIKRERVKIRVAMVSNYAQSGKCDFCGSTDVPVLSDYDTAIPDGAGTRLGFVCASCDT